MANWIEWKISIGNLLTIAVTLIGVIISIARFYMRIDRCMHDMHAENRMEIAIIKTKLEAIQLRCAQELERHRG